jgi:hypothetical protein
MRRRIVIALVAVILALLPGVAQAGPLAQRGEFTAEVTRELGAPVTLHTRRAMQAELQAEGGGARYNPFNTTLRLPGSTTYNSVGVQNYVDAAQGVEATVKTLKENHGQRYHLIRRRLRANASAGEIVRAFGESAWGTNLTLVLAVLDDIRHSRKPNALAELEARYVAG